MIRTTALFTLTALLMIVAPANAHGPSEGVAFDGLRLYISNCLLCHGPAGNGTGPYANKLNPKPRAFTDRDYFDKKSHKEIYNVISKGGVSKGKSLHMRTWGLRFNTQQIHDLVAYIRSVSREEKIKFTSPMEGLDGEKMFTNFCSTCHGTGGKGDGALSYALPNKPANIASEVYQKATSDSNLFKAIKHTRNRNNEKIKIMPPWGGILSDEQIKVIIRHIRTLKD